MQNKILKILFVALMVLIAGLIWQVSLQPFFHVDEIEAVHTAWKISQGEHIYVDFFQHHHPFFYYTLVPLLKLVGETAVTLLALRMFVLLLLAGTAYVSYRLARELFDKETAAYSLILLSSAILFIHRGIEIRPDIPQTFFGVLSLFFFFKYLGSPAIKQLVLSAVALALSFLFLQKTIFLILLLGLIQLAALYRKRLGVKDFLVYWLLFLTALSPYYIYLVASGSFMTYIRLNWLLNFNWLKHVSPTPWVLLLLSANTVLCLLYPAGLWLARKGFRNRVLIFLSFTLFFSAYLAPEARAQYFLLAMPLVAIPAGVALKRIREFNFLLVLVLVPIAVFPALAMFYQTATQDKDLEQFGRIEFARYMTSSRDHVYDGNYNVEVFNVFRPDIDYFWFSFYPGGGYDSYTALWDYDYDIYADIDKYRPRLISDYNIRNTDNPAIEGHYAPSSVYDNMFIRE